MIYPTNIEQKIDFQVIRDELKGFCTSSLGKERVDQMQWLTDYAAIQALLLHLREMIALLSDASLTFPKGEIYDLREALSRIRIEGLFMDESELFSLRKMLDYAAQLNRFFSALDKVKYPILSTPKNINNHLSTVISSIDRILDRYGKMRDNASPELARIRKDIHHSQGAVSRALNTILRQAQAEGILDKDAAILHDKDKVVFVTALGSSSVDLGVRCWFNGADYWEGLWRLNETIKKELDANGIEIPFSQLDVHIKEK